MKNFEFLAFTSADELAQNAAIAWLDEIESANQAHKLHCVALSGGRITQKFFIATVELAKTRKVSFGNVHLFWADERCVPPTDPESNFKLANDLLFAPLQISENQIHRLRGEDLPEKTLEIAEKELRQFASADNNGRPILDLIFLGMGEDGHIASLFPQNMDDWKKNSTAAANDSFLLVTNSPKPPPRRISLNYEAILAAKNVWALVSGAGKETALKDSLASEEKTPLGRVIHLRSATKIFSDLSQI